MKILIPTSTHEYDPTEVAVPWKTMRDGGHEICFATDSGKSGEADKRMLSGQGFGILKPLLIAQKPARDAYHQMLGASEFQNPLQYDDIVVSDFDGLILPGGHAKGIIPYLESKRLQKAVAGFFEAGKPVGAICHRGYRCLSFAKYQQRKICSLWAQDNGTFKNAGDGRLSDHALELG